MGPSWYRTGPLPAGRLLPLDKETAAIRTVSGLQQNSRRKRVIPGVNRRSRITRKAGPRLGENGMRNHVDAAA